MRSQIKPPTEGEIPNGHRISNPFSQNEGPDWVQPQSSSARRKPSVSRLNPLPTRVEQATEVNEGSRRATKSHTEALQVPEDPRLFRPPIPKKPISLSAQQAAKKTDSSLPSRSSTLASRSGSMRRADRKSAPSHDADEYSGQFLQNDGHRNVERLRNPTMTSRSEQSQALPAPRRSQNAAKEALTSNLLDDEFDGAIENWRPLTPRR